jgi:hypothetical protein
LRYNPQNALANPVINGGFDIWQRGTSFSLAASAAATFIADRWQTATGTNQAATISRQATGDTTNLPNIQYCVRLQRNSGQTGTGGLPIVQSHESTNVIPFAGKTVTYSFYARGGANFSGSVIAYLFTGTGTDQDRIDASYTGNVNAIAETFTPTTTWQRYAYTVTLQSSVTEFATYFLWSPSGTAGAADYVEITGVQMDLGTYTASTAPAFRRTGSTIQGELAACQRYYWRVVGGATGSRLGYLVGTGGTSAVGTVPLPVIMRTIPTVLDYADVGFVTGNSTLYTISALTLSGSTNAAQALITATLTTTASDFGFFRFSSATGFFGIGAEL